MACSLADRALGSPAVEQVHALVPHTGHALAWRPFSICLQFLSCVVVQSRSPAWGLLTLVPGAQPCPGSV